MTEQEAIDIIHAELPKMRGNRKFKNAIQTIMNSVYGHANTLRIGIDGPNMAVVKIMRSRIENSLKDLFAGKVEIKNEETEN